MAHETQQTNKNLCSIKDRQIEIENKKLKR